MKNLKNLLENIKENDIFDMGEDYEGNPVFTIKLGNNFSTLIVGNQDPQDYE